MTIPQDTRETIPDDVMDAASALANKTVSGLIKGFARFTNSAEDAELMHKICTAVAAEAIMAEREAQREKDAQIALAIIPEGGARLVDPRRDHAHAIAAAIRQSKEPVEP